MNPGKLITATISVPTDVSVPSAKYSPTPVKTSVKENTTAQYQLYPPKPINLTTANSGLSGIGSILFLLAIMIILKLLLGRSRWKQQLNEKKSGRSATLELPNRDRNGFSPHLHPRQVSPCQSKNLSAGL
ncbi:MAG: hypothetical protein KKI01_02755 [Proteobacteria bacterium]|jgi:uncharacterized protein HemX|nr:hypothetical protein [Pseudomonadota bacterium]